MISIETPRLYMREFQEEDAENFFLLNNDPEVLKYTGDKPFASIEESRLLIANYDQYKKYKRGRLTVFLKETNEFLGWCGLKYHSDDNITDIGYRLKRSAWNKRYATEAAKACIDQGFLSLNLKEIVGHAMKDNRPSIRIFEKLGMHYVKDIICGEQPSVFYKIENPASLK